MAIQSLRILLIAADPADRAAVAAAVVSSQLAFTLDTAPSLEAARPRLASSDAVIIDFDSWPFMKVEQQAPATVLLVAPAALAQAQAVVEVGPYLVCGAIDGPRLAAAVYQARERNLSGRLQQLRGELRRAQRGMNLGQLLPSIAHELNNPLALIGNNLYLLERDFRVLHELLELYRGADEVLATADPGRLQAVRDFVSRMELDYTLAKHAQLVEKSRGASRRLQQLIRDTAEIGSAAPGAPQVVDLNAHIEGLLRLLTGRAHKQGVALSADFGTVPPVACRPRDIGQALLNLLLNSIEASVDGGTTTVRTRSLNQHAEIHVEDNGRGIEPALRPRVFEPFFTTKPPGEGCGLGLPVAADIVAEHEGRLDLDSTPGQGTRITIQLPLTPSFAPT